LTGFLVDMMTSDTATVVVVIVIVGCLSVRILATNESVAVVNSSDYVGQNTTEGLDRCPPRTQHAGLRYVVAKFNFSHVQTPFIVAAWIMFVTLAKIGTVLSRI